MPVRVGDLAQSPRPVAQVASWTLLLGNGPQCRGRHPEEAHLWPCFLGAATAPSRITPLLAWAERTLVKVNQAQPPLYLRGET